MRKNKQWNYETKVKIVNSLLQGQSYSSLCKEYGITSSGMIANWKKAYLNGTLIDQKPGRPKGSEEDDYEILKKCYAQLMKIRSR